MKRRTGFFSTWKPHLYVFKNKILFEYKEDADIKKDQPARSIHLKNAVIRDAESITDRPHSFVIILPTGRTYFLDALSQESKINWLVQLGAQVTEIPGTERDDISVKSGLSGHSPHFIFDHLDKLKEPMVAVDSSNTIIAANKAAAHLFSFEPEEVKGENISCILKSDLDPEKFEENSGHIHEVKITPFHSNFEQDATIAVGKLPNDCYLLTFSPLNQVPNQLARIGKTLSNFF